MTSPAIEYDENIKSSADLPEEFQANFQWGERVAHVLEKEEFLGVGQWDDWHLVYRSEDDGEPMFTGVFSGLTIYKNMTAVFRYDGEHLDGYFFAVKNPQYFQKYIIGNKLGVHSMLMFHIVCLVVAGIGSEGENETVTKRMRKALKFLGKKRMTVDPLEDGDKTLH